MSITLLRHEQDLFNIHEDIPNPSLSSEGFLKAKDLTGTFDICIISPLKRTLETINTSQIQLTHKELKTSILNREIRQNISDFLEVEITLGETDNETEDEFSSRMVCLRRELSEYLRLYKNILVVSHGGVIQALTNKIVQYGEFIKYI